MMQAAATAERGYSVTVFSRSVRSSVGLQMVLILAGLKVLAAGASCAP